MSAEDTATRQKSCEERIDGELRGRLEDFRDILKREERASAVGNEERREQNFEEWDNYPLSVEVYKVVRVQLSWGGPADEFEVEIDNEGYTQTIRYRYQDWFDGAARELSGEAYDAAELFLSRFTEIATL